MIGSHDGTRLAAQTAIWALIDGDIVLILRVLALKPLFSQETPFHPSFLVTAASHTYLSIPLSVRSCPPDVASITLPSCEGQPTFMDRPCLATPHSHLHLYDARI